MMLKKPAQTSVSLNPLLQERWSPRSFQPKAVSQTDLTALLEAARWAASCNNGQPWRFLVATRDDAAGYAAALQGFNERNQRWAQTAPVLVFTCARKTFEANGNPNGYAGYDTGAAVAMLTVEAETRGLRVHQAAGIEKDKIRATFGVPDEYEILSGLTIGYQDAPDALPEDLAGREKEPRARKPLSEIAFAGKFGAPAKLG
jgi:nitroreductase